MHSTAEQLERVRQHYQKNILPLETRYGFPGVGDLYSKSMVLLLGQYSTGKTSFIQRFLGKAYHGSRVGPEPTTDCFNVVLCGEKEEILDGPVAANLDSKLGTDFSRLKVEFGNQFMDSFQCSCTNNDIIEDLILVDTPGVVTGKERGYDYQQICGWFASRADVVIVFFDANKLEITPEFLKVIEQLRGSKKKLRLVLNKADAVQASDLLNVFGQLMWTLAGATKDLLGKTEVRLYVTAFDRKTEFTDDSIRARVEVDERDLVSELRGLPTGHSARKFGELMARLECLRVHIYIMDALRRDILRVWWWQRDALRAAILRNLEIYAVDLCADKGLSAGNIPDIATLESFLVDRDWVNLPRMSRRELRTIDHMLDERTGILPTILRTLNGPPSTEVAFKSPTKRLAQMFRHSSGYSFCMGPNACEF